MPWSPPHLLRWIRVSLVPAGLVGLVGHAQGCGGGELREGLVGPNPVAFFLTPSAITLTPGQSIELRVFRSDDNVELPATEYIWTATGGDVTPAGRYTAGTATGAFAIVALDLTGLVADTAAVTITTNPPNLVALELSPASATLATGETVDFQTIGRLSDGSEAPVSVTYSATGGSITQAGRYTAGGTTGSFRVVAAEPGGLADTSSITITGSQVASVNVTPGTLALTVGSTDQLEVQVLDGSGAPLALPVTWSSTAPAVAVVTPSSGLVSGVTPGQAQIIASVQGVADTALISVTLQQTFNPPDIMSATFDGGDYGVLQNFPTPRTLATTSGGWNGTAGVESRWGPSFPDFSPVWVELPPLNRAFFRVYFRMTAAQLGQPNMKYFRHSGGGNIGNAYLNNAWGWGWDAPGELAVGVALGIFEGPAPSWFTSTGRTPYLSNAADGQWHYLEYELDKSGGRWEIRFWIDGVPIVMPAGNALSAGGYFFSVSRWEGGVPGIVPSTLYAQAGGGGLGSEWNFHPEHSPPVLGTGSMFWDNIAVSSERIGR